MERLVWIHHVYIKIDSKQNVFRNVSTAVMATINCLSHNVKVVVHLNTSLRAIMYDGISFKVYKVYLGSNNIVKVSRYYWNTNKIDTQM